MSSTTDYSPVVTFTLEQMVLTFAELKNVADTMPWSIWGSVVCLVVIRFGVLVARLAIVETMARLPGLR